MSHLCNWSLGVSRISRLILRSHTWNLGSVGKRLIHGLAEINPVVARGLALYCVRKIELVRRSRGGITKNQVRTLARICDITLPVVLKTGG